MHKIQYILCRYCPENRGLWRVIMLCVVSSYIWVNIVNDKWCRTKFSKATELVDWNYSQEVADVSREIHFVRLRSECFFFTLLKSLKINNSCKISGFCLHVVKAFAVLGFCKVKQSSWIVWPLKMGLMGCHERFVTYNQPTPWTSQKSKGFK